MVPFSIKLNENHENRTVSSHKAMGIILNCFFLKGKLNDCYKNLKSIKSTEIHELPKVIEAPVKICISQWEMMIK